MRRYLLIAVVLSTLLVSCCNDREQSKGGTSNEQFKAMEQPSQKLTNEELSIVNDAAKAYMAHVSLTPAEQLQFAAYLAHAQKQYADISEEVNGSYKGSFAPVTIAVIRLFDPSANIPRLQSRQYDLQTIAIADFVADGLEERLREEKGHIHPYYVQIGPDTWFSGEGYYGITFGSIKPWYMVKCDQFRCNEPDSSLLALQTQAHEVKRYMQQLDPAKIEAIHYWADRGDWEEIAEAYMVEQQTPLKDRLQVRLVLISALNDAKAAAFDSKYTFWIKRPSQIDATIEPIIPAPNHPSYPSGHSTIGKTAAVVLSHYFPENRRGWELMAQESGMSRIWAGIHYPMDHTAGVELGEKVGQTAIDQQSHK